MSTDSKPSETNISGHVQADLKRLGKYEIVRKIGAGGMGTVYLAQDQHLNRTVALKVLPRDRAENPILVRRFQSEARASAMLTHDNIVAVFDADEADGYLYIALEYIDGIDLFEWLKKRERIPVKRSIDIIKQVTAALIHAHEKNLVHRDIKPANIMITRAGLVKLADMGLARSVDESLDTTITRDGTTVGTVDYMSPEQAANSKNTDIRSDIYSLGCTWYHMLTGQPPFREGSLTNKLAAHAKSPPPDPRELNEGVSDAIVAIIHRMMAKAKRDRYQTPQELLDDINNSSNLESNTGNLFAMLLEEDEFESRRPGSQSSEDDEDFYESYTTDLSVELEVQDEPQEELLKKSQRQAAPETKADLSEQELSSRKRQSKKQKQKLPPKTSKQSPSKEPSRKTADIPESRKPLRRVTSFEELQEVQTSESRLRVQTDNLEAPVEEESRTKKNKKQKTEKNKSTKKATVANKKNSSNQQAAKRPKSNKEQPFKPQKEGKSLGINIEWGRAGLVVIVSVLALAGGWWGLSKFRGDISMTPVDNPYEDSSQDSSGETADPPPQTTSKERSANQENVVDVLVQPVVEKIDEEMKLPRWVVKGWERPIDPKLKTYTVRRGRRREHVFHTLDEALGALDEKTGTIDLSDLTAQSLQPVELSLSRDLKITASNSKPILAYETFSQSSPDTHWLTTKGGTLILDGLNIIVTNASEQPLEFIKLQGTDLLLRNCTFTAIGANPVHIIGVHEKSVLSNRIFIENCLFRGENISCVNVDEAPCDLFCQNTFMASHANDLLSLHSGKEKDSLKAQFRNCTFVGGSTTFSIATTQSQPADASTGKVELGVNRCLIMGEGKSSTTAVKVSGLDASSAERTIEPAIISVAVLNTKFINMKKLASLKYGEELEKTISDPGEWAGVWGVPLLSGDVIQDHSTSQNVVSRHLMTAENLETQLEGISRTGLGERSLLGVDVDHVATVDSNAVERQLVMNRFTIQERQTTSTKWSGEVVRFDLKKGKRLNAFLASDKCPDGTTVVCFGAGLRKLYPVKLKNRKLRLRFEQTDGTPLSIQPATDSASATMFDVEGGEFVIENGLFQIQKSRADKAGLLFLKCSSGANVQLIRSQVSAPTTATGNNQLIASLANSEGSGASTIEVLNSMLSHSGTLIDFNATHQNLILKNSIFASKGNVITLSGSGETGMVLLDRCTFSQGAAVIDCRGSQESIAVLARDSVFAPSVFPSSKNSLLSGSSHQRVQETLNWWELACGHSNQLHAPVIISNEPLAGSYENSWKRFCGPHHVYDFLSGPQAVVLTNQVEDEKSLSPKDFELQTTGTAASWGSDGSGIGAQPALIGPQSKTQSKPKTQPRTINTPSGF